MNTHRPVILLATLLSGLMLVSTVMAQGSANYGLSWNVIAGGGGTSQSSHYVLSGTIGQGVVGASVSARYRLAGGFWHASGVLAPPRRLYLPVILKQRS